MEFVNSLLRRSAVARSSDTTGDSKFMGRQATTSSPVGVGSAGAAKILNSNSKSMMSSPKQSSSGGGRQRPFHLTELPEVPLDKVISYLDDEDLRRFHQVSHSWKTALERRTRDDQRRQELVKKIRENKENIRIGPATLQDHEPLAMVQRAIRERGSSDVPGIKKAENSVILMECTNQVTPTSVNSLIMSTPVDKMHSQTPSSPFEFQEFEKAEQSLERGQKLLQCRKCRGPVPSPATPVMDSQEFQESRRLSSQSTRCKLISRLDDYPLESPLNRECKKVKTLSTVDISPIQYAPQIIVANLREQTLQSLAMSSPCLTTTSNACTTSLPPSSPVGFDLVKRSTSCSSITGIDLPQHVTGELDSPITLSMNSSSNISPFFNSQLTGHHKVDMFSLDLNDNSLNCSRSCCSPRRVNNNSHMCTSHFSDSGLSFDGDSVDEFNHNMILSPEASSVVGSRLAEMDSNIYRNRNSIERVRDSNNYSDAALSLSSYSHLQQSDPSLNFNYYNNNTSELVFPNVLECPNPKCGFRFCSNCEESEHSGRPCHVVSSDQFESFSFDNVNNNNNSFGSTLDVYQHGARMNSSLRDSISSNSNHNNKSSCNRKMASNSSSSSSKGNRNKNSKKTPLRRLARL